MKYSLLIIALLLVGAETVSAAGMIPCEGVDCTECDLVALGNELLKWLIGVLMVVFAIITAWAGFGLVTSGGNPSAKQDAKNKLSNAIIGLIIVLAAWLLVDTVMRALLPGNSGKITDYGPWSEIRCGSQTTALESAMDYVGAPAVSSLTGKPTPKGDPTVAAAGLTETEAKARLAAAGIDIKTGDGAAKFEGLRPHVIEELKRLESACNCDVLVTEATGGFHADGDFSHKKGFKTDLRKKDNPQLLNYIESALEPAGSWQDGTKLYYDASSCATYAVEETHIDVVYKTGCK